MIKSNRVEGYDLIRSTSILIVFLGHATNKQVTNDFGLLIIHSLSPGLTMSLLGFISAALLSAKKYDFGTFLVKRFTRIYISLTICLTVVLFAHALIGKKVITQHALLHFMGLSAFFDLFLVHNKATIGDGLWFITAILLMYFCYPILQLLFNHSRSLMHLIIIIIFCTAFNFFMYGTASIWNVVISFTLGVYLGVNGHISRLTNANPIGPLLGSLGLLAIVVFSSASVIPYNVRHFLYPFYPLSFVPLFFYVSKIIHPSLLSASKFFANLSFEFYILHFYLINSGFKEFFPFYENLYGQIVVSFIVTLIISYIISMISCALKKVADDYLLQKKAL